MSGNFEKLQDKKSRQFKLLLYADNKQHMRCLHYLRRVYPDNFIGCWHRLPGENGAEIMQGSGKKHAHILLDFPYPRGWGAVCKDLYLPERFCWHMKYKIKTNQRGEWAFVSCKDTLKKGFVYLVHHDDPMKEQYSVDNLFGADRLLIMARNEIDEYDSKLIPMSRCLTVFQAWLIQQTRSVSVYAACAKFNGTPYQAILRHPLFTSLICEHNRVIYAKQDHMHGSACVVRGNTALAQEIDEQIDREQHQSGGWNPFMQEGEIPF